MKKYLIGLSLIFLLAGCSGETPVDSTSTSGNEPTDTTTDNTDPEILPDDDGYVIPERHMQDTPMLHCFNWKLSNITANLDEIASAGFKTIQISPMQVQKDYEANNWKNVWWKLYQPLSFTVANGTNQNILGNKSDLVTLCDQAKAKGIDVIVDIVSNHLGGGDASHFHSGVETYENEIYTKNLLHNLGRSVNDNDKEALLKGNLGGYPDIQTENSIVQQRVLSLLKEYLDCGIRGFRFDAAKHIETPDDGSLASNYWPTILDGASQYAATKGYAQPYYYGEILYTVGAGRTYDQYTKYMSVTDNVASADILEGVTNKNLSKLNPSLKTSLGKTVLWAESHDTYSNDDSSSTLDEEVSDLNKAYVVEMSRRDVSSLYLSRPKGQMGDVGEKDFLSPSVKAINTFHTYCAGLSEHITTSDGYFINERSQYAVAVVNINGSSSKQLTFSNLNDGNYINLITGENVTISNHTANVTFTDNAYILISEYLANAEIALPPSVNVGSYNEVYSGSQNISVNATNADSLTYKINNGSEQPVSNNQVTLPSSLSDGIVELTLKATNDYGSDTKTIKFIKTSTLVNKSLIITNVDKTDPLLIWAWRGLEQGHWYEPTFEGNIMGLDMGTNDNFIVVKFNSSVTPSDAQWSNAKKKTPNMEFNQRIYDFTSFEFVNP